MKSRAAFVHLHLAAALFATAFIGAAPQANAVQQLTRTSGFEYYPNGLLKKEIIEPDFSDKCLVTEYTYDDFGNRKSVTTRNCQGLGYGFGSSTFTEAVAPSPSVPSPRSSPAIATRTSTTGYTAADAPGCIPQVGYVAGRFPIQRTNALGHSECLEHNTNFGGVSKLTGPNTVVTWWEFDSFGRKTKEHLADNTYTWWRYYIQTSNQFPALTGTQYAYYVYEIQDINGSQTGKPPKAVYYDILNRPVGAMVRSFSNGWTAAGVTQYDNRGRVVKRFEPYDFYGSAGAYTATTYDDLNRPWTVTTPTGAVTTTTYNGLTITASVDPDGPGARPVQTKKTVKNSQGQVVSVRTNEGGTAEVDTTVTYTYDPFGNLLTTTDALSNGNVTTLSYDIRGRKTQMVDPDMGRWTYRYNVLSELLWQCDPVSRGVQNDGGNPPECTDSSASSMTYDLLGRMTNRTERDLVSNWVWDSATKGIGKLGSVTSSNGYTRTHTYEPILGRPESNTVTFGGESFEHRVTYDSWGHILQVSYPYYSYPNRFAVTNSYTTFGYLKEVRNVSGNALLWRADTVSPSQKVLTETLGSNLTVTRTYDTGDRLWTVQTSGVQNDTYAYDLIGNLTQRTDAIHSVTETMEYDRLNRLTGTSGAGATPRAMTYNAIGNIQTKSDVGTYSYPSSGPGSVRPHAVSSVAASTGGITATYGYDANGNVISLTSGTLYSPNGSSWVSFSRSLSYMSFNLPSLVSLTQNGWYYAYTYTYGPDHERVKVITDRPDETITSVYVHPNNSGALSYERDTKAILGEVEHKHYVTGGAGLVGVFVVKSTGLQEMRYYHKDHLGSIVAITGPTGAIQQALAYEAFGERRYTDGTRQNRISPLIGIVTDRGFTSHEHLDEMNLIHMNGRIYDPALGRFMTPDPFVQSPGNPQSYNRYSYVFNNPVSGIDPSGYGGFDEFADRLFGGLTDRLDPGVLIGIAAAVIIGPQVSSWYVNSVSAMYMGDAMPAALISSVTATGGALGGLAGGFAAGFIGSGGDLETALKGSITGGIFGAIGGYGRLAWGTGEFVTAHAIAGCVIGAASGGGCGPGALSAGFAKYATLEWLKGIDNDVAKGVIVTTIGGTASALGGGKFENGATTAAFAYLFSSGFGRLDASGGTRDLSVSLDREELMLLADSSDAENRSQRIYGRTQGVAPMPPGYRPPPGIELPKIEPYVPQATRSGPGVIDTIVDWAGEAAANRARDATGIINQINPPRPAIVPTVSSPKGGICDPYCK